MRLSHSIAAAVLGVSLIAAFNPALAQGGKHFARTDTNGDGKISLQEFITQRGRIFERIDANHDGVITPDEINAAVQAADAAQAGRMIRSGKQGGEGGRQLERLSKIASENGNVTRQKWDQIMTRRFEKLDVDHTGFITMEQMRPHRAGADDTATPGASASQPRDMAVPMASTPPR